MPPSSPRRRSVTTRGGKADGRPRRDAGLLRLFLIPGVHHCGGGPGLSDFDALTLLENWVEKGQPPDVLLASRKVDGVTERTAADLSVPDARPLFRQGGSETGGEFCAG